MRILAIVIGVAALAVGGFATYIFSDWPVHAAVVPVDLKVEVTPERVARGRRLVSMRCAQCHYDQKTGTLSGHKMLDAPPAFGVIYSHNITRSPQGTGRYTDGELYGLLRTGVRRDGIFTGPFMQSPLEADEDLYDTIAFLRSDDPWVKPTEATDGDWQPTFLAKMLMHVAFHPAPVPKEKIVAPAKADKVAYGRYLATALGECYACHSASFSSLDHHQPESSAGYFGGGNPLLDSSGRTVRSANLTMDEDTGIGRWTEAEFVKSMRSGFRPDGRTMRYPMDAYTELSEEDDSAIFAYLKTVPTQKHAVERGFDSGPKLTANTTPGEKLYNQHACFACHGDTGAGVCDLRQASKHYRTDDELAAFIRDPPAFVVGTKMPVWRGVLAEGDYAPLIEYVHALEKKAGERASR